MAGRKIRQGLNKTVLIATVLLLLFSLSSIPGFNVSENNSNEILAFPPGWSDDYNLTLTDQRYSVPSIASYGPFVHNLFVGTDEIYYAKSASAGDEWNYQQLTSYGIYGAYSPDVSVNQSNVHAVWRSNHLDFGGAHKKEIIYRNSTDNGETWNNEILISPLDGEHSIRPHIACFNQNVHVVWADERTGDYEVFYKMSKDGGNTWQDGQDNINQDRRLTFWAGWTDGPSDIAVSGNHIQILFSRITAGNVRRAYYLHSPDNGASWASEIEISNDPISAYTDAIATESTNVHIVWTGFKDGNEEIYYRTSADNGTTWNPEIRLTFNPEWSDQHDIAVNGSHVFVAWMDDRDHYDWTGAISGAFELYYIESFDSGATWGPETRLTYAVNNSIQPTLAMDSNYIHVAWTDNRTNGSREQIFYKRYPDFPPNPEYNISLQEGWNLVSLPFEQSNESIDQVLSSITGKWDCIQIYDPLNPELWKTNNTNRPDQLNDFNTLNHKQGFWINITEPGGTILTISGYDPSFTSIPLYAGWNLVGYPTLNNSTTVANALWGTGADKVEVFDPGEPYRIREVGPSYIMRPGEGYWVHVVADSVWVVDW